MFIIKSLALLHVINFKITELLHSANKIKNACTDLFSFKQEQKWF